MTEEYLIDLRQITEKYLVDNGYDGLWCGFTWHDSGSYDVCWCVVGDLMPTSGNSDCPSAECSPGYRNPCKHRTDELGCNAPGILPPDAAGAPRTKGAA